MTDADDVISGVRGTEVGVVKRWAGSGRLCAFR